MSTDKGIPNLDALEPDELGDVSEVFENLRRYCTKQILAITHRKVGHIAQALHFENECEVIYKGLPNWARW